MLVNGMGTFAPIWDDLQWGIRMTVSLKNSNHVLRYCFQMSEDSKFIGGRHGPEIFAKALLKTGTDFLADRTPQMLFCDVPL
jgi:hypothetical protein